MTSWNSLARRPDSRGLNDPFGAFVKPSTSSSTELFSFAS